MADFELELDPQSVVRSIDVQRGGFFSPSKVEVEYEPITFKFTNKAKTEIICNACQGAGKRAGRYHGWAGDDIRKCNFCDGKGTLKLKKASKAI